MRTVLFAIETSDPDGAEKMLLSLADALDKTLYRPVACLLQPGWLADEAKAHGYPTYVLPLKHTVDVPWLRQALRLMKAEGVDLIHAHEFAMNTYGALLSALTRVPCITTIHGKNYSSDRWHRRAAYRLVARRTKMIAVSDDIKNFLATTVGVSWRYITTIANGIHIERYAATDAARARLRAELGLSMHQPVVGSIGRLEPVKGHAYLLEAARSVCERHPDAVFVLAGQGQLRESLARQANALGLDRNVRFLGYRDDVATVLAALDIFALPSLSEGLPLSLLEAMAAGKPIVASDVGGIPEVIRDGESGLLARPAAPTELADRILTLIEDPSRARGLADNARAIVSARFGMAAMVSAYENLYRQMSPRH